jgi:hypothetical protein
MNLGYYASQITLKNRELQSLIASSKDFPQIYWLAQQMMIDLQEIKNLAQQRKIQE